MIVLRAVMLLLALLTVSAVPAFAADGKTGITWLGHSSFKIQTPGGKILFIDPWIENPANPKGKEYLAGIDKADLILVTHGHFDHVGQSVEIARKTGAKLVANFDLAKAMVRYSGFPEKQMDFTAIGSFGGEISLLDGEIRVKFVPALHGSSLQTETGGQQDLVYAGNPGGFVITVKNGPTIYHTGDTEVFSDMALYGPVDVMIACIGDRFTMGPKGAALATKLVKAKTVVPMHYGTFPVLTGTPEEFARELKKQGAKASMKRPAVGETLYR